MAKLRSVIVHDDVSFIEIRRGEGIDGGDTIVVGVEHPGSEEPSEGYYFLPSSALRLNRYRLRLSVADIEVRVDSEVAKMLGVEEAPELLARKLLQEGRLALPQIGGRYPSVVIELLYADKGAKMLVRLRAPR